VEIELTFAPGCPPAVAEGAARRAAAPRHRGRGGPTGPVPAAV